MNYIEWADEYLRDADRVYAVIEKKKAMLNERKLSRDDRKILTDTINAYRGIYRDLLEIANLLRKRGGRHAR